MVRIPGNHSEVHQCRCRRTGRAVAVKKVQIFEMDTAARRECVNEAKLLQTVPDHVRTSLGALYTQRV